MQRMLLLASRGDEANRVAAFCRSAFGAVSAHHGDWGDKLPEDAERWSGDLIVSYCSRWVVPGHLLKRARLALNFHPAPPEYPGIGGLNFALYKGDASFGVTCHHMAPRVDAGEIVEVRRFPVLPADTVASLFVRTHLHLEALACDVLAGVALGHDLPRSVEEWSGERHTRADLDALATIRPDMSAEEIARRARATTFGKWRPTVTIAGHVFELKC